MSKNSIDTYFDSICRIIVDEYNYRLEGLSLEQKRNFLRQKCENDFVFQLGQPFGELASFPTEGSKGKDIRIDKLGFDVSVKLWRPWINKSTYKTIWMQSLPKEIYWLFDEIEKGNKGKRIVICGWGTVFKWKDLLQLGGKTGGNPKINKEKLALLPFLKFEDTVSEVETRDNYKDGTLTKDNGNSIINWRLIGEKTDDYNIVMYW